MSTLLECSLNDFMFNTRRCLLCHKLQRHFNFLLKQLQRGHFSQHFGCLGARRDRRNHWDFSALHPVPSSCFLVEMGRVSLDAQVGNG